MRPIDGDARLTVPNVQKVTEYDETGEGITYLAVPVEAIEKAPTIEAEPVVHCKDCKHFRPYEGEEYKGDCAELIGLESCVYEDDYCSYGEKRDSEDDEEEE